MTATRQTPTDDAFPGGIGGTSYADAVNTEVSALWNYVVLPLGTIGGSANALSGASAVPLIADPVEGSSFEFTPTSLSTGAATIAIDGRGPWSIKSQDGNALIGGELRIGRRTRIGFDGTNFRLVAAPAGVLQVIYAENAVNAALTTILPQDDTVPVITEGTEILTATITPRSAASKIMVRAVVFVGSGTANVSACLAIFRGSICIQAASTGQASTSDPSTLAAEVLDAPAVGTTLTYSVRIGPESTGTIRINGNAAGRFFGGTARATLVLMEID